jgi:hypothetical protein
MDCLEKALLKSRVFYLLNPNFAIGCNGGDSFLKAVTSKLQV